MSTYFCVFSASKNHPALCLHPIASLAPHILSLSPFRQPAPRFVCVASRVRAFGVVIKSDQHQPQREVLPDVIPETSRRRMTDQSDNRARAVKVFGDHVALENAIYDHQ